MKSASLALTDFLLTATAWVRADLYSFTLANGAGVLRYASTDTAITANGESFGLGPLCQDAGVDSQRGVHVSSVDITLYADERHTVAGKPFLDFVEDYGLDGASVRIERAFAASAADMATKGPVGTYVRFAGRVSEAQALGATQVVVQATDLARPAVHQPARRHLPDLVPEQPGRRALRGGAPGLWRGGGGRHRRDLHPVPQRPDPAPGWFSLGKVAFTGGVNAGVTATVKDLRRSGRLPARRPAAGPAGGRRSFHRLPRLRAVDGRLPVEVRQPGALPRPALHPVAVDRAADVTPLHERVVAEAMSWLGTPYAHRQRLKGVGVDCAQLPLAVYAATGLIPAEADVGAYAAQWHLHRGEELYLRHVEALGGREIAREEAEPGDFAIWRYGRTFSHGAVLVGQGGRIVHAVRGQGVVLGDLNADEDLRARPVKLYRLTIHQRI